MMARGITVSRVHRRWCNSNDILDIKMVIPQGRKEQNMDCLAVSQYADGWYLDLPFVDVFDLYNPDDIKKNYLEIIHNAMFAKVSKGNYIAYWFNLIGNIPLLLYKYQIDIQWGKMHNIFNDILDLSLVYRGDMRTGQ